MATSPSPTAPTAPGSTGAKAGRAAPRTWAPPVAVVAVAAGTAAAAEVAATTTSSPATAEVVAGARTMSSPVVAGIERHGRQHRQLRPGGRHGQLRRRARHGRPGGGAVPERGGQCQPGRPQREHQLRPERGGPRRGRRGPGVELQRAGVIPARRPDHGAVLGHQLFAHFEPGGDQGRPRLAAPVGRLRCPGDLDGPAHRQPLGRLQRRHPELCRHQLGRHAAHAVLHQHRARQRPGVLHLGRPGRRHLHGDGQLERRQRHAPRVWAHDVHRGPGARHRHPGGQCPQP